MQKDLTKFWTEINVSQTQDMEVDQNELLLLICLPCNAYNVCLVLVPDDYDVMFEIVQSYKHCSAGRNRCLSFFQSVLSHRRGE